MSEDGEAARVRRRHLTYYLALAEEADREAGGAGDRKARIDQLEEEHDNLRAALAFSLLEEQDGASRLRLAGSLCWFWVECGYFEEGRKWCSLLLGAETAEQDAEAHAKLLQTSRMMVQETR